MECKKHWTIGILQIAAILLTALNDVGFQNFLCARNSQEIKICVAQPGSIRFPEDPSHSWRCQAVLSPGKTALEAFMALIFHGFKTAQGVIHRKSHYIPTVLCVGKNLKPKKLNKPPFSSWACFGLFQINAMSFNLASKSCRNASHESCSLFLATRLDYSWSEHQWVTCMCPLPLDFWPFCTDSALPGLQFSRTSQHTDPFQVYSTVYTYIYICIHIYVYIYIWYIYIYIYV